MPYVIEKRDNEFCVVKSDTGKVMHSYSDKTKAEKYMKALSDITYSADENINEETNAVVFTGDFSISPASATFSGKLFQVGEYPDKEFSLNLEEATYAVNDFEPADLTVEHISSLFDGKLGRATRIWLNDENFSDIMGEVELNPHIREVLGNDPIPVSCTFDRNTKKIRKVGLVKNPRVSDAAISAAFSAALDKPETMDLNVELDNLFAEFKHNTPHGQRVLQNMHDMAAQAGAKCKDTDASMTAAHEATAMQQIHDMTIKHGASCSKASAYPSYFNKDNDKMDETKKKTFLGDLQAAFNKAFAKPKEEKTEETVKFDATSDLAKALIKTEAENFAFKLLREEKIVPAQKDAVFALFTKARVADLESGDITFSQDMSEGTFVKELSAMFSAAVPHGLSSEKIVEMAAEGATVLVPNTGDAPTADQINARVDELLKFDPIGKQILAKRNKENK